MKNRLVVINPVAGKGIIKRRLFHIINKMQEDDTRLNVYVTRDKNFNDVVSHLNGIDEIICCGGDGTLSRLINILMGNNINIPIGYLPFGTTNDFGRNIGMGKNLRKNIKNILSGSLHKHDVGKINDSYFNYVAAFGMFVNASSNTPQKIKNILGRFSYIVEGVKELTNIPEYDVKLIVDGEIHEGKYSLGMVGNSKYIGGFPTPKQNISLNDGVFEVYLYKKPKPLGLCKRLSDVIIKNNPNSGIDIFRGSNIEIMFNEEVDMTIDGEPFGAVNSVKIQALNKVIEYKY